MPTLMTAYKYAKLRATGSFDALNKATASVPIKTDILRYETQAGNFLSRSASGSHPKEAANESTLPKYRKKIVTHTAFVREPHLALDPHGRRSLLRHPDVRRRGADRVVVPHARHLAVLLRRLDVRNLVRTGVARRAAGLFGELGERRGGEGREEIRHGVPGATDDRAVVRAGAGADAGGSRETGHGSGKERTAGVGAVGLMAG